MKREMRNQYGLTDPESANANLPKCYDSQKFNNEQKATSLRNNNLLPPARCSRHFIGVLILAHQTLELKLLRIPQPLGIAHAATRARMPVPATTASSTIHLGCVWVTTLTGERPGVDGVEVEQHDYEQEEEEGDAEKEEDVGHVSDVSSR